MLSWKNAEIQINGKFLGRGIMSKNDRYFITANGMYGSKLLWILYDLVEGTYEEGFLYQRDAKAHAENN